MIIYPDGRLEGTPEELKAYKEQKEPDFIKKMKEFDNTKITERLNWKCPSNGPCYCTGACMGKDYSGIHANWQVTKENSVFI